MTTGLWDRETFIARLREIGESAYHHKHPFHVAMNEGRLSPEAVRGWVANRFYYQRSIPVKDAAILSNCPLPEVRRVWIHRIADHDGTVKNEGGIEAWLRLGEACCLSRYVLMQD
jgi:pyrroloquinoline-quinone synthase